MVQKAILSGEVADEDGGWAQGGIRLTALAGRQIVTDPLGSGGERMGDIEDPVPMLEQTRLQFVPIANIDGVDYCMDLFRRGFREIKQPRVRTPFGSCLGLGMVREITVW